MATTYAAQKMISKQYMKLFLAYWTRAALKKMLMYPILGIGMQ